MSAAIIDKTVFGNKRLHVISYTASGAEDNITVGLSYVDYVDVTPVSIATALYKLQVNANSSGTASNGNVAITGVASGDRFYIKCFGK